MLCRRRSISMMSVPKPFALLSFIVVGMVSPFFILCIAEDHPSRGRVFHREDFGVDHLSDVFSPSIDDDHRSIFEIANPLPRLFPKALNLDFDVLSRLHERL